jgi:WD40 repeat protein
VQTLPHGLSVTSLAFSPDSARLAAGGGSSKDGASVRIWEVSTGKLVKQIDGFTQPLNVVAMNDTTLYAVDFTRMLYRCSLETGQIENRKQLPSFSPYVRFTSDLKQMVFLKSGRVAVWDVQDDKELRGADLPPAAQPLGPSLQITADARMAMVSTSKPYHIVVLDLVKGTPIKTLEGHDRSIRAVGLAPDGARAFSIDSDKTIRIWKLDDAVAQVAALKPETKPEIKPETPETKPETKFDAKLDPKFMPEWESIKCPSYSAVAITPDGKRAVTAGPGFDVWDLTTGNLIKKISAGADDSAFGSVALSPDGSQALSITGDNLVRLWDLSTGRMVRSHSYGTGRPHCVAWAGNGQVAAVGGKYLYIIDPESLNTKNTVSSSKEGDVLCAAFYGQGSQIVFGHEGGAVRAVPSTGSGTRTVYTQVDGTAVHDVAMTGNIVLSGGVDKLFYVWDTTRGKGERLDGKTIVRAVETSPKGTYALTAGEDKKIRFWHIKTGRMMQAYSGHDATVRAVAFSPNGLFFLSTSEDGALRAWKLPKELGK